MSAESNSQTFLNDAFISYSRKDREFAARLQEALGKYKPPTGLNLPQRNLVVFRDEADFAGVAYYASIEKHLKNSRKMILICSPHSRKSQFVNDEIRRFAQERGKENIISVLISGIPNNEAKPEQEEEKAFPEELCKVFEMPKEMPAAASYIGFDPKKDKVNKGDSWYTILSNLYDLSRREIEERDRKRQIQTRNRWIAGAGVVILILAVALIFALISRQNEIEARKGEAAQTAEAKKQRDEANVQTAKAVKNEAIAVMRLKEGIAEKLAGDSRRMLDKDVQISLLLSVASFRMNPKGNGRGALQQALAMEPRLDQIARHALEDGWLASVSPDGTLAVFIRRSDIVIMDVVTSRPVVEPFTPHRGASIISAKFSPDGKFLAVAYGTGDKSDNEDSTIFIWDVTRRKERKLPAGIKGDSNTRVLTFSSARSELAVLRNKKIELWDIENGVRLGEGIPEKSVASMSFAPSGDILATGDLYGQITFWNVETMKPLSPPISAHQSMAVNELSFSPEGAFLASVGADDRIVLWDVLSRTPSGEIKPPGSISLVHWNEKLIAGGMDGTVRVWEITPGASENRTSQKIVTWREVKFETKLEAELRGLHRPVIGLIMNENENGLQEEFNVSGWSSDGVVARWNAAGSGSMAYLSISKKLNDFAFSPDGKTIALTTREKGPLFLLDVSDFEEKVRKRETTVKEAAFGEATAEWGNPIFSSDGKRIIAQDKSNSIWVWEVDKPESRGDKLIDGSDSKIHKRKRFAWNGRAFVAEDHGENSKIILWTDVTRQSKFKKIKPSQVPASQDMSSLAMSPNGKWIAFSYRHDINVWLASHSASQGQPIGSHYSEVTTVAFHPKGLLLASGGNDGIVRFWDLRYRREDGRPLKLDSGVEALAFTKDGATLATINRGGMIQLWDVERRMPITDALKAHSGRYFRTTESIIAISPDGKRLMSARCLLSARDKEVSLWNVDIDEWASRACQIAGRNLTEREWNDFVGNSFPYQKVCPVNP